MLAIVFHLLSELHILLGHAAYTAYKDTCCRIAKNEKKVISSLVDLLEVEEGSFGTI